MNITYGKGFAVDTPMRERVKRLQRQISTLPQYEPETKHYFHAGMYCREVAQDAEVLIVGKVHKREHFFLLVSGTLVITEGGDPQKVTGPHLLKSNAGTKRAIYSETPALFMTIHICKATTVEEAERELVEDDETGMFGPGNLLKHKSPEVLK